MTRVNIYDQISGNKRMSYALFSVFFFISFILAFIISEYIGVGYLGVGVILFFAVVWMLFSYYYGDKAILTINHAREVKKGDYPYLFNSVEGISIAAGIPKPRVYVIDDPAPNAFATGRDPEHASVAVSTGLLERMNRLELEGVLAHELSHIKNYDIRYMMLVMVMIGLIGILSNMLVRMFFYGRGSRQNRRSGYLILIGIIFAIIAPIIAQVVRLAISRKREYMADASAALLTRYPQGLADALKKIARSDIPMTSANQDSAPLYIANPFRGSKDFFSNLFSTHPPITSRIKALESM
jgi:heat shock protein HtpX